MKTKNKIDFTFSYSACLKAPHCTILNNISILYSIPSGYSILPKSGTIYFYGHNIFRTNSEEVLILRLLEKDETFIKKYIELKKLIENFQGFYCIVKEFEAYLSDESKLRVELEC